VELADDCRQRRKPVVFALEQGFQPPAHLGIAFSTRHRFITYRILYPMRPKSPSRPHAERKSKVAPRPGVAEFVAEEDPKPRPKSVAPKPSEARRNDTIHVQPEWLETHDSPLMVSIPAMPLPPGMPGMMRSKKTPKAPPPLPPGGGHATRGATIRKSARPSKGLEKTKVRAMQSGDLPDVCELNLQLGYSGSIDQIRARFEDVRHRLEQGLFVALFGERPVGWLHVHSHRSLESEPFAEITGLVVDSNERRRGVGRALVARACEWAKDSGHATLRVHSNVQRKEAGHFYPALGFRIAKTQQSYLLELAAG
jgi:GNAT superfamily N-acetyltransferase